MGTINTLNKKYASLIQKSTKEFNYRLSYDIIVFENSFNIL